VCNSFMLLIACHRWSSIRKRHEKGHCQTITSCICTRPNRSSLSCGRITTVFFCVFLSATRMRSDRRCYEMCRPIPLTQLMIETQADTWKERDFYRPETQS
jgi:hypothetical protein